MLKLSHGETRVYIERDYFYRFFLTLFQSDASDVTVLLHRDTILISRR